MTWRGVGVGRCRRYPQHEQDDAEQQRVAQVLPSSASA